MYRLINIYRKTKLKYKDEYFRLIEKIIICFSLIFEMLLIYSICRIILKCINDNIAFIFIILFELLFIYVFSKYVIFDLLIKKIKRKNYYKKIIKNGESYDGIIKNISYDIYTDYIGETNHSTPITVEETKLIIEYNKNGRKEKFISEDLAFNPVKYLGNLNCKIYIYNNKMYVSNFTLKKEKNINPWVGNESAEELIKKRKKYYSNSAINIGNIFVILMFLLIIYIIINYMISK